MWKGLPLGAELAERTLSLTGGWAELIDDVTFRVQLTHVEGSTAVLVTMPVDSAVAVSVTRRHSTPGSAAGGPSPSAFEDDAPVLTIIDRV